MKRPTRAQLLRLLRTHVFPLAILVFTLTAFRSAVADWQDVPTGSMNPTILEGDRVLVNNLAFGLRVPFTNTFLATWSAPQRPSLLAHTRGDIYRWWVCVDDGGCSGCTGYYQFTY